MQSQFRSNSKLYLTDVAIGQFHLLEVIFNIILGDSNTMSGNAMTFSQAAYKTF